MARIGTCYPRYAKYAVSGTSVVYSDGGTMGKATSVSVELDSADANILYADNGPAESAKTFNGGTLTVGLDELRDAVGAALLGWTAEGSGYVRMADASPGYVGVGFVVKHITNNTTEWDGYVLPKVQFSDPGISVETQGETIDWQTPELEATILRDEISGGWCKHEKFSTEASAQAFVNSALSIT